MPQEKIKNRIEEAYYEVLDALYSQSGINWREDDSLQKTPHRIAKMLVYETCKGLFKENYPSITVIDNTGEKGNLKYNQMLVERNIKVHSMCEHHWQNIVGVAYVAYIPKDKVIGLSKLNRIVDYFSRRPQVQERLTEQIHENLVEILETEDVAVIVDAEHHCIKCRGVEDGNSSTVTSKLSGAFKEPEVRKEFMDLIMLKK